MLDILRPRQVTNGLIHAPHVAGQPHPNGGIALPEEPKIRKTPDDPYLGLEALSPRDFLRLAVAERALREAETVMFTARHGGTGDQMVMLRGALAMARAMPNKQVGFLLKDHLRSMTNIDFPPNTTTFNFEIPDVEISLGMGTFEIECRDSYGDLRGLALDMRRPARIIVDNRPIDTVDKRLVTGGLNSSEVANLLLARAIGINLTAQALIEPFVRIEPDMLPEQDIDVLLVPEASSSRARDKTRSIKSFTPGMWKRVFKEMKALGFDGTMAILEGHVYKEYVYRVHEAAFAAGINVSSIYTPTFDSIIPAILRSKRYVGMDTGPTHLAADVIRAAQRLGHIISLKQVFNALAYDYLKFGLNLYGLRDAAVLRFVGFQGALGQGGADARIVDESHPERDQMSRIDPRQVAAFLME